MKENTEIAELNLKTFSNEKWLYDNNAEFLKKLPQFNKLRYELYEKIQLGDKEGQLNLYKKLVEFCINGIKEDKNYGTNKSEWYTNRKNTCWIV